MEQNEENSVIMRAKKGDQDAICCLYEDTKHYAFFVARRYLQNDEDIADALQEAYLSAFSKLNTFESGRPFKPWLHTIIVNKCLNFIKSKRVIFVSQDEIGELASDDEELIPAHWLERAEKRRDVMRIIDGLPEGQRIAVTLFYLEGLFIADMAGIMGIAEGTVKAHLYHARKTIKREVLREEEKGNKLYAIVPLPLLTQLFELEAEAAVMPEALARAVWAGTIDSLAANGVVAGANAAAAETAAKGGGIAARAAALSAGAKAVIGAAAIAVAVAVVGIPIYLTQRIPQPEPPATQATSEMAMSDATPALDSALDKEVTIFSDTPSPVATNDAQEPPAPLEPVQAAFSKDAPYQMDIDGDGIADTITVKRGGSADTLVIESSMFGEYSTMFDYTFPPDYVELVAIDTGNPVYSLCVLMDTGGSGGAGSVEGLILCGTDDGWKRVTSLLSLSYTFTGEILDNQTFSIEGKETDYAEQLATSDAYMEKGKKVIADDRISSVSFVLNEDTGVYDFVLAQYLFSGPVANGVGSGYTQVSIDIESKTLIPVKQWAKAY